MENNLKLVCPKCGTPHQPHSPHTMDADGFERCEIRTVIDNIKETGSLSSLTENR